MFLELVSYIWDLSRLPGNISDVVELRHIKCDSERFKRAYKLVIIYIVVFGKLYFVRFDCTSFFDSYIAYVAHEFANLSMPYLRL